LFALSPVQRYSSFLAAPAVVLLFRVTLLAGKCSLANSGLGALDVRSNPLTQTNPGKLKEEIIVISCFMLEKNVHKPALLLTENYDLKVLVSSLKYS